MKFDHIFGFQTYKSYHSSLMEVTPFMQLFIHTKSHADFKYLIKLSTYILYNMNACTYKPARFSHARLGKALGD